MHIDSLSDGVARRGLAGRERRWDTQEQQGTSNNGTSGQKYTLCPVTIRACEQYRRRDLKSRSSSRTLNTNDITTGRFTSILSHTHKRTTSFVSLGKSFLAILLLLLFINIPSLVFFLGVLQGTGELAMVGWGLSKWAALCALFLFWAILRANGICVCSSLGAYVMQVSDASEK